MGYQHLAVGWVGLAQSYTLRYVNGAILSGLYRGISTSVQDYPAGPFFWSGDAAFLWCKSNMLETNHTLATSTYFCSVVTKEGTRNLVTYGSSYKYQQRLY